MASTDSIAMGLGGLWVLVMNREAWSVAVHGVVEKGMATTPAFVTGKPRGQRSLVGYSPRDHKESDMMEQLSTHICITENSDWYKAFVIIMLQTSTLKSLI